MTSRKIQCEARDAGTCSRLLQHSGPSCAEAAAGIGGVGGKKRLTVCNLYSITKGPQAIRDIARAMRGDVGNMPPLPGVFPDYSAPIVATLRMAANWQ
jgi:hypothetical protein